MSSAEGGVVDSILDDAATAVRERDWPTVIRLVALVELVDPGNRVAAALQALADDAGLARPPSIPPRITDRPTVPLHRHSHELEEVLRSAAELTPFSAVALRLVAVLDDELSSADDVARLASTDPALTARILHVANTAFYRRRIRVATIREAVTVLGAHEVRSLVVTTCVVGAMPRPRYLDHQAFWRFSIAVALLADLIARSEGEVSGEAFTAGILHNVGLLVLDQYCPEGLQEVVSLVAPGRQRLHDRELEVFGFTDADLGRRLAMAWQLPRTVIRAIELHGMRRDEIDDPDRVASALVRARIFARAQGLSDGLEASPPRDPGDGFLPTQAQARLNQIGRWEDFIGLIDGLLAGAHS